MSVELAASASRPSLVPALIRRSPDSESASSSLELFYDLVFAFTITQVSHLLIGTLNWTGAIQAGIVLLGAWWSWNYTTWFTDELEGDAVPIRLLMVGLMALSLLMAIAIPEAFGDRGWLFALTYVAIQLGRHGFLAFATAGRGSPERERALHILIWFLAAGVFWIGGAFVDGRARLVAWAVAVVIDYVAPRIYFRVPGRSRLGGDAWQIAPSHFVDRFASFIILTLGEAIAITGATMTADALSVSRIVAFVVSFLGSAAFWWLYFSRARDGAAFLSHATTDGQTDVARDAFAYGHVLLVAGILLAAAGDEFVLDHPLHALSTRELLPVVLGPVVFLLGQVFIAWRMVRKVEAMRLGAVVAVIVVGVGAGVFPVPALAVSGAILLVLAAGLAFTIRERPPTHDRELGGA
ncbi:MAG: low temperature requirement protein A [Thermomicrobiales bacterium]